MKWFDLSAGIDGIKKRYRELAKMYHPDVSDNPDANAIMQEINNEYEKAVDLATKGHQQQQEQYDAAMAYASIIDALIELDGIIVEVIGTWIWLSGETYKYKDIIKELGFRWASVKKMWVMPSSEYRSRWRNRKSIEEIRAKYGVKAYHSKGRTKLNDEPIRKKKNYYSR